MSSSIGDGPLRAKTPVRVCYPDFTAPSGMVVRDGTVQFLQSGPFEQAYSWPRGVVRYCVYFARSDDTDQWVDRRWMHVLPPQVLPAGSCTCAPPIMTPSERAEDAVLAALQLFDGGGGGGGGDSIRSQWITRHTAAHEGAGDVGGGGADPVSKKVHKRKYLPPQ